MVSQKIRAAQKLTHVGKYDEFGRKIKTKNNVFLANRLLKNLRVAAYNSILVIRIIWLKFGRRRKIWFGIYPGFRKYLFKVGVSKLVKQKYITQSIIIIIIQTNILSCYVLILKRDKICTHEHNTTLCVGVFLLQNTESTYFII